jgi:hypothetical protein
MLWGFCTYTESLLEYGTFLLKIFWVKRFECMFLNITYSAFQWSKVNISFEFSPFEIFHSPVFSCVEVGKNTSTVIPASRKRRRKGNPVVPDETIMYGYESSATLTTDRLHYKLQTRHRVREGAPKAKSKAIFQRGGGWKGKSKICLGCPTPRRTGLLTVGHNINST